MLLDFHGRPIGAKLDNIPGTRETRRVTDTITEYRDWARAAEESQQRRAVSRPFRYRPPDSILGYRPVLLVIVKPKAGDPYAAYYTSQNMPIRKFGRIPAHIVDQVVWWRPY